MKSANPTALEPWQMRAIQDDKRRGMTIDALADAYRVSRRTIYRCLDVRVERVYVHGWTAFFAISIGNGRAPQRLTPWEPA